MSSTPVPGVAQYHGGGMGHREARVRLNPFTQGWAGGSTSFFLSFPYLFILYFLVSCLH